MTAPYIPPRKSLRDALTAASMGMSVNPTTPDRTATPGYQPPPTPVMSAATPRPRMTPQSDLANALRGEDMGDTPMGFLNEVLNPIRQGAQARQLLGDAVQSVSRNRIARGVGQGALGLAAVVPGLPDEVMQGIRRLYHGSPVAGLTKVLSNPTTRQYDNATSELGAFFSPNEQGASRYAGDGGAIYEADMALVRPYRMSMSEFNYYQNPLVDADGSALKGTEAVTRRAEQLKAEAKAFRRSLEEQGYDGVVVSGSRGPFEIASFKDVDVWPMQRERK